MKANRSGWCSRMVATGLALLTTATLRAEVEVLSASMPVIVIVDQSGSMAGGFDWLAELLRKVDAGLAETFGRGGGGTSYGLVGFGLFDGARSVTLDSAELGSVAALEEAVRGLRVGGRGQEDGYQALRLALDRYATDSERGLNIVLVTDEDRDELDFEEMAQTLGFDLAATNTVLDVLVNVLFRCNGSVPALGMNALGISYSATRPLIFGPKKIHTMCSTKVLAAICWLKFIWKHVEDLNSPIRMVHGPR